MVNFINSFDNIFQHVSNKEKFYLVFSCWQLVAFIFQQNNESEII